MSKVLIVDDERHILEYYSRELSEDGHQVITEDSGEQLLAKIALQRPDIVILDIKLLQWDGLELLREIRNRFYDLPVILCTAYDTFKEDDRSICADYYVVKSYDLSELKTKIRRALSAHLPLIQRSDALKHVHP